jgi:mycoredoxin
MRSILAGTTDNRPVRAGHVSAVRYVDLIMSADTAELTMYTTTWCGYCVRLKTALKAAGITWKEVDIERDEDAAQFVMSVNGGNQTVPTVKFPDGSALTNPSIKDVKAKLGR